MLTRTPKLLKKIKEKTSKKKFGTSKMKQTTCNWVKRTLNEATQL